jgi:Zn-dependent peptidase ImmA (M78 family)
MNTLLSIQEYAKQCGVSRQIIYQRIKKRELVPTIIKKIVGIRQIDTFYIDSEMYGPQGPKMAGRPKGAKNKPK